MEYNYKKNMKKNKDHEKENDTVDKKILSITVLPRVFMHEAMNKSSFCEEFNMR